MLSVAKLPVIMFVQKSAYSEKVNEAMFRAVTFDHFLIEAADAIRAANYRLARDLLKQYMAKDMENPEAYNLLGISYELEGDRLKAAKFYRVSYYMDQTFSAPANNLDRVCMLWYKGQENIFWGLERVKRNS